MMYINQIIYVWIYENRVKFEAKLSHLPAGDSWQGGLSAALKARGTSVKEGWGR